MMSFQNSVFPVTLATCFSVLLQAEAKPYGGMMPSAPIVDASPWMPIAQPSYYSGGYNSYQPSYGTRVAPLQTKSRAYSPTAPKPEAPASQWVQPNPAAPAASPWFQPPQISEAPAPASQWVQPNPTTPEAPATSPWVQPAAQNSEAPAVSQWEQPNPTIPEVPAAIPSASQQWAPAGAAPVVPFWMSTPNSSPMSPPPPVADPTVDVPAITSPQPENTPVLPESPPPAVQPENGDANVIFNSVQVSVPAVQGSGQDNWPETPRMVPEADNLPALPPATFGQFAVQPAR
ncbi:predicted GPI-anchored protein 58 [Daphnia pulex]|uniref:predicted GPI-anchored protein 58 n=1 Tax=Daphnia pulex TaxID=6669 RepID=UPI001EE0FC78|nr:predicted GPI-anchored protein 58 [Daphnia pulex]